MAKRRPGEVRFGRVILGEWARPKTWHKIGRDDDRTMLGVRLRELEEHCNAFPEQWSSIVELLAHTAAGKLRADARSKGRPFDERAAATAIYCHLRRSVPQCDREAAVTATEEAVLVPKRFRADTVARILGVTDDVRAEMGYRTIGSIDVRKAERTKRRRSRDAERKRDHRKAEGAVTRDEYLARSVSEICRRLGISRNTYYQRRRKGIDPLTGLPLEGAGQGRREVADGPVTSAAMSAAYMVDEPVTPSAKRPIREGDRSGAIISEGDNSGAAVVTPASETLGGAGSETPPAPAPRSGTVDQPDLIDASNAAASVVLENLTNAGAIDPSNPLHLEVIRATLSAVIATAIEAGRNDAIARRAKIDAALDLQGRRITEAHAALASHPFLARAYKLMSSLAAKGHPHDAIRLFLDRLGSGEIIDPEAAAERACALLAEGMTPLEAVLAIEAAARPKPQPPPRAQPRLLVVKGGKA